MWRSWARTCKKQGFFNTSSTQTKKIVQKMENIQKNLPITATIKNHSEELKGFLIDTKYFQCIKNGLQSEL